eukprot:m.460493 g.460493  ORF g.460493 m.460493 type:complete len:582 (-) comp22045_c0_seq1:838-2583(-)
MSCIAASDRGPLRGRGADRAEVVDQSHVLHAGHPKRDPSSGASNHLVGAVELGCHGHGGNRLCGESSACHGLRVCGPGERRRRRLALVDFSQVDRASRGLWLLNLDGRRSVDPERLLRCLGLLLLLLLLLFRGLALGGSRGERRLLPVGQRFSPRRKLGRHLLYGTRGGSCSGRLGLAGGRLCGLWRREAKDHGGALGGQHRHRRLRRRRRRHRRLEATSAPRGLLSPEGRGVGVLPGLRVRRDPRGVASPRGSLRIGGLELLLERVIRPEVRLGQLVPSLKLGEPRSVRHLPVVRRRGLGSRIVLPWRDRAVPLRGRGHRRLLRHGGRRVRGSSRRGVQLERLVLSLQPLELRELLVAEGVGVGGVLLGKGRPALLGHHVVGLLPELKLQRRDGGVAVGNLPVELLGHRSVDGVGVFKLVRQSSQLAALGLDRRLERPDRLGVRGGLRCGLLRIGGRIGHRLGSVDGGGWVGGGVVELDPEGGELGAELAHLLLELVPLRRHPLELLLCPASRRGLLSQPLLDSAQPKPELLHPGLERLVGFGRLPSGQHQLLVLGVQLGHFVPRRGGRGEPCEGLLVAS